MLSRNKTSLQNYTDSIQAEWLETNGLGGWSGSSLPGCNTRRYHGLLMAAVKPPAVRMLLVSKLDETIIQEDRKYELATNDYGDAISPGGYQYLEKFERDCFPTWTYAVPGIVLHKAITMVHGENTTLIRYEVLKAGKPFTLELLPLIAARGYHELQNAGHFISGDTQFDGGIFRTQPYDAAPVIYISVPGATFTSLNRWYYKFNYAVEKYRGLDYVEDLFNHGLFHVELKAGDVLHIMLSTEDPLGRNPALIFESEIKRKMDLLRGTGNGLLRPLVLAAAQFIVNRELPAEASAPSQQLKTIIAGYHWFTDWGRDTMIALPGLCLETGRNDDAKKILSVFTKSVNMGMIPNRFPDHDLPPEYNNVDGTLWYFNAVYAYLRHTRDQDFVLKEVLPVLKDIIAWHFKGTRYNIHADSDGLLFAGEAGQQLTWMDAKTGDWVVTPRIGKPVEIQALWYNALKIFESLLELNGEHGASEIIHGRAARVKESFENIFWYAAGGYLPDLIDQNGNADNTLRPNQVFALSLSYPLIDGDKAKSVMNIVRTKLFTPVGLRSLSADDPAYQGHYGGPPWQRDGAYHQGTVWSWLLGPYIDAGMKCFGESFRPEAMTIIENFSAHLGDGCIGSVSEIFDGDPPHHPRGCVAQAWSVAEILRVIKTYSLLQKPA